MKMDNIKVLQNLVRPEQFTVITDWNKARNDLEYKAQLEHDMLKEEIQEYFEAEGLVDRLDAVADILFVGVGTTVKGAYNFIETPNFVSELDTVLSDFAGRCTLEDIDISFVGELIGAGLDIVCAANLQKLIDKDTNGKVMKPEGFVPPEEALQKLIDATKEREVAQPQGPDMSQVFKEGR